MRGDSKKINKSGFSFFATHPTATPTAAIRQGLKL
jgi:hypothetical protein